MIETKAKIIDKKEIATDVLELLLKIDESVDFIPGQFFSIKIIDNEGKAQYRSYSIANHPNDPNDTIRLVIKILKGGLASEYFQKKSIGDEIEIKGPAGFFAYKSADNQQTYLVCTGTGIVPLMTMLQDQLINKGNNNNITLIFGNRYNSDIFWEDKLKDLKTKYSNFNYELTFSRPDNDWTGHKGYSQELLTDDVDYKNSHFYLCGIPQMIEDTKSFLIAKGAPKENIFEEKYTSIGKMLEQRSKK